MDETKAGQEAGATPPAPQPEQKRNWTDTLNALLVAVQSVDLAMKQAEYLKKQEYRLFRREVRANERTRARHAARETRTERLNLAATALNGILAARVDYAKTPAALLAQAAFECAAALLAVVGAEQPARPAPPTTDGSVSMAGKEK